MSNFNFLGWDFSSRWYIADGGVNEGNLSHINTRQVIPVDLNSFLCLNARLLSKMYSLIGDQVKSDIYHDKFLEWKEAIQEVNLVNIALPFLLA